jgi:glycosyltransferase involved in cell wall biosynthesis
VYNEVGTIKEIVSRVQAVDLEKEIIIVDDGSTDGTRELLQEITLSHENVRVLYHDRNQGKGAALRTGFESATGDIVLGNKFLTLLSNALTNLNLTDMETCYKVFRREVLSDIQLKSNRFGFEPEFTAKIAKKGFRIYETSISYSGRTYAEGKKIGWKDGVKAIVAIIWFRFFD